MTRHASFAEHAGDVLGFAAAALEGGDRVAIIAVTGTEGGAVRAPGALMAVTAGGVSCGYVSGGCIDADLALRARHAAEAGQRETLRYGLGSPFVDIALPCGGAIDVAVDGQPEPAGIAAALAALDARQPAWASAEAGALSFGALSSGGLAAPGSALADKDVLAVYRPKLRLRLAGRGADPVALATLARASGYAVTLWTPDPACAAHTAAASLPVALPPATLLETPQALPSHDDDPWTAFVLMFHDPDWEDALLAQALSGPAFYVGAVGSRRTHAARIDRLLRAGLDRDAVDRIHGPVGLLPSMRNASSLAISALAEIIGAYERQALRLPSPATAAA